MGFPYMASAIKKIKAHSLSDVEGCMGSYDWEWIYSVANKFVFYGEPKILYYFREHPMQDTRKNSILYRLTRPYIFEEILLEKVSDPKLRKEASKKAFWELIHLKAITDEHMLKEFLNGNSKYHKYLRAKLDSNNFLKATFAMPRKIVYLIFKSLRKVGLVG
jgi:hypothetical protein